MPLDEMFEFLLMDTCIIAVICMTVFEEPGDAVLQRCVFVLRLIARRVSSRRRFEILSRGLTEMLHLTRLRSRTVIPAPPLSRLICVVHGPVRNAVGRTRQLHSLQWTIAIVVVPAALDHGSTALSSRRMLLLAADIMCKARGRNSNIGRFVLVPRCLVSCRCWYAF